MFHQKRNQDTRLPAKYDCKIRIRGQVMGGVGRRGGEDSMGTNLRVELQHGLLDELYSAVLIPTWQ